MDENSLITTGIDSFPVAVPGVEAGVHARTPRLSPLGERWMIGT